MDDVLPLPLPLPLQDHNDNCDQTNSQKLNMASLWHHNTGRSDCGRGCANFLDGGLDSGAGPPALPIPLTWRHPQSTPQRTLTCQYTALGISKGNMRSKYSNGGDGVTKGCVARRSCYGDSDHRVTEVNCPLKKGINGHLFNLFYLLTLMSSSCEI